MDSKVRNMRLRLKWSKYRLAKEMGVSWNTVHLWDMGIWEPNKENAQKLEGLLHGTATSADRDLVEEAL